MMYQKDLGWYYTSSYRRAPAWTSVQYLYQFMRSHKTPGPRADEVSLEDLEVGDVIQLAFGGGGFAHSLFVVEKQGNQAQDILIATHSQDSDYRALSTYENVSQYRYLKIMNE